jgi:predicted metal-dependent hydrolase
MAKNKTIPQVDENFMKEVISQGFPMNREKQIASNELISNESFNEKPLSKEKEEKKKRTVSCEYANTFFEKLDFTDRQLIYITRDTHETMTEIVNVVGGKKATLSSYVENIIRQHLESHKEEINALYASKFKKPIP